MPVLRSQAGNRGMPTMQDVADHAQVSIATVSNVLNYPNKVTASTAQRVRQSIDVLGFVRNNAGRSLAMGSSSSVGMVVADLDNSLFTDMAQGAQAAAHAGRLSVLLGTASCSLAQQDAYLDLFDEARVRGVLLAPMEDSSEGIRRMRSHGRQIVLLNYTPEPGDCCAVVVDNDEIGYLAAQHLIDLGRERLVYLAAHDDYQPVHDRRLGIRRAVAETGGRVSLEEIATDGLTFDAGRAVAREIIRRDAALRPDGIIAVTDSIANGVVAEILDAGSEDGGVGGGAHHIAIPEDVAVVGCEDNRTAEPGPLFLTTFAHPGWAMGEEAMSLLDAEVGSPSDHRHRTTVFQATLVVRETTVRNTRNLPPAGR